MSFITSLFKKPKQASAPKIATPTTTDKVGPVTNLNRTGPAGLLEDPTQMAGRGTLLGN